MRDNGACFENKNQVRQIIKKGLHGFCRFRVGFRNTNVICVLDLKLTLIWGAIQLLQLLSVGIKKRLKIMSDSFTTRHYVGYFEIHIQQSKSKQKENWSVKRPLQRLFKSTVCSAFHWRVGQGRSQQLPIYADCRADSWSSCGINMVRSMSQLRSEISLEYL